MEIPVHWLSFFPLAFTSREYRSSDGTALHPSGFSLYWPRLPDLPTIRYVEAILRMLRVGISTENGYPLFASSLTPRLRSPTSTDFTYVIPGETPRIHRPRYFYIRPSQCQSDYSRTWMK